MSWLPINFIINRNWVHGLILVLQMLLGSDMTIAVQDPSFPVILHAYTVSILCLFLFMLFYMSVVSDNTTILLRLCLDPEFGERKEN